MIKSLFSLGKGAGNRVYGLDILRALAILIVVDAHGGRARGEFYQPSFVRFLLPDGVELFFVLSGFLIGGILIRSYEKAPDWSGSAILNFWTRRWFRTLPNYYLVLFGLAFLTLMSVKLQTGAFTSPLIRLLPLYPVFLQNFTHPSPGFFTEAWSLAIEEWSYLLLPTTLWLLHRLLHRRFSRQSVVLALIAVFLIGTNALRLYRAVLIPAEVGEQEIRNIVLYRLDAIVYGVLGAYFKQYYSLLWHSRAVARSLFALGLGLILVVSFTASIWMLSVYSANDLQPQYVFYKHSFYLAAMGFSMVLILPLMDSIRSGRGWLARAVTHISLISYSMYLVNLSLIMHFLIDPIPTTSALVGWFKYGLYWALVIMASTLLYRYFEKPMTDLRDRVSRKEPKLVES